MSWWPSAASAARTSAATGLASRRRELALGHRFSHAPARWTAGCRTQAATAVRRGAPRALRERRGPPRSRSPRGGRRLGVRCRDRWRPARRPPPGWRRIVGDQHRDSASVTRQRPLALREPEPHEQPLQLGRALVEPWLGTRLPMPYTTHSLPTCSIGCTTWAWWPSTRSMSGDRTSLGASACCCASGRVVLVAPVQGHDHDLGAPPPGPGGVGEDAALVDRVRRHVSPPGAGCR